MAKKSKMKNPRKIKQESDVETVTPNPLMDKILLSGYQIHDSIILSNFENITQLEVSDNNIDYLDLSSLKKLQVFQCRRNALRELIIDAGNLVTLTATKNDLTKISVLSEPSCLYYVDISSNKFKELPPWLDKCINLHYLSANNNVIEEIGSHFINSKIISLHTLQLANNKLKSLPEFTNEKISLRTFALQCNELEKLPNNLFSSCFELTVLNVSYNKLQTLPDIQNDNSLLEKLLASKNQLNNSSLDAIKKHRKLRILHLAYNNLTSLPITSIEYWSDLEELVIAGNKVDKLPENISTLKRLRVLRLHSNLLKFLPDLSNLTNLHVLDLAHNQLNKVNLGTILPRNVRFLDLSCNQQLQVDSNQLKTFQAERSISFVDVTGKNRFCLPTSALLRSNTNSSFLPWKLGFSETPGKCAKLWISQLRLPHFCNTEGLIGMFDGQANNRQMKLLPKIIPTILLQHRVDPNNPSEYMKYTLISAYENLNTRDRSFEDCAILCHIVKEKPSHGFSENIRRSRKYVLRIAVVGQITAFLIPKQQSFPPPPGSKRQQFKKYESFGKSVHEANVFEITLNSDDEYLIICSKNIWETVCIETVIQEIQNEQNLILAAKKIQDIAQSFGLEQNISIIILKFDNVDSYVDRLINELKQNVQKKKNIYNCPSCVHTSGGNSFDNHLHSASSARSSPIGQSDQGISELSVCSKRVDSDSQYFAEPRRSSIKSQSFGDDNISRLLEESDIQENESLLSEEQFKCWEYMLEQNTQLLFDKELNKITNFFVREENSSSSINLQNNRDLTYFGLMRSGEKSKMSSSLPQLLHRDVKEYSNNQTKSLASKYFGSARSFQQFKSTNKNFRDRFKPGEDTSSGYFGSLRHILPYGFENEFAITHERKVGDDSVEYASRMSQYWGVTSTEL
ncbi:protein phosphatase PHLPP-like protein [Eupeodes corollae]|uniref:protein phosphatase PHLPP-like protein n=1 Tax=Eupeodes corollae TaxID=290404 RepID=UPI002491141B|nr:protein phosphatase PHLPP-like protein [Eupeodes corollae]